MRLHTEPGISSSIARRPHAATADRGGERRAVLLRSPALALPGGLDLAERPCHPSPSLNQRGTKGSRVWMEANAGSLSGAPRALRPSQRIDSRPDQGSPGLHQELPLAGKHMKAIVQDTYGSADVLELRDIDIPVVGDADVLVRVHAAGVEIGVWHVMAGKPYLLRIMGFGLRRPKVPVRGRD